MAKKYYQKIYKLFLEDQKDHSVVVEQYKTEKDWEDLAKRDKNRQEEIISILKNKLVSLTGEDYFMAAMIFQHGATMTDSKRAIALAKKGIKLGSEKSKWLYASAVDRFLMRQKKKQKFGTQYVKKGRNGKWSLYPVDSNTSDKERAKYNIISLKQAKSKAENWNKKSINPWQERRKTVGITSIK